jgi:hypothetical protein
MRSFKALTSFLFSKEKSLLCFSAISLLLRFLYSYKNLSKRYFEPEPRCNFLIFCFLPCFYFLFEGLSIEISFSSSSTSFFSSSIGSSVFGGFNLSNSC